MAWMTVRVRMSREFETRGDLEYRLDWNPRIKDQAQSVLFTCERLCMRRRSYSHAWERIDSPNFEGAVVFDGKATFPSLDAAVMQVRHALSELRGEPFMLEGSWRHELARNLADKAPWILSEASAQEYELQAASTPELVQRAKAAVCAATSDVELKELQAAACELAMHTSTNLPQYNEIYEPMDVLKAPDLVEALQVARQWLNSHQLTALLPSKEKLALERLEAFTQRAEALMMAYTAEPAFARKVWVALLPARLDVLTRMLGPDSDTRKVASFMAAFPADVDTLCTLCWADVHRVLVYKSCLRFATPFFDALLLEQMESDADCASDFVPF